MKRSKTTALLMMSAAPLVFSACQREPQVQVQEGLYTSVDRCVEATGNPSACRTAFEQARQQAADAAPKYASRAECERDYAADQCVQQHTSTGHAFIGPMMAGFFMSHMLNSRAGLPQPPAAPAYQDRNASWARPSSVPGTGGLNTASAIGSGKSALSPITQSPNRAVTVSRGGFGSRSSHRSFGS